MKKTLLSLLLASSFAHADGTLTIAQRLDPNNWDPIDTFSVAWGAAASNFYDALIRRDENLKLQPGLATAWEVSEDGKSIRFTLRQGVKFHNGEDFNADAVVFTFERLLGEEGAKGPQRSNYTTIDRVEKIDDHTVVFHLNTVDPVMLTKLSGYGAMIVPPGYIREKGDAHFNLNPVGTGPFRVKSYTQGDRLEMEANPDYFDGAPKLSSLTYRFIKEDATRLAELQAGRVDIIHDIAISGLPTVQKSGKASIVAVDGPAIQSVQFNVKKGITSDVRVRRALNMAVDRQAIIDALLSGYGKPIASLQGALSFGYDDTLAPYPYDPEGAKKLLAEAGVKPGSKIAINYRATNSTFNEVALALSGFFSVIGLETELKPTEDNVFQDDLVPNGKTDELFQFGWGGWTFDFDNTAYLIYHSGEKWNPYGTSPEMDKLLETERASPNQEERLKILKEIGKMAHEAAYHIPLYNEQTIYAVGNHVQNFVPAPDRRMRYHGTSVQR